MKRIVATFYRSATGSEPVRDWLLSLSAEDRKTVGVDIAKVEFGWPVGMPVCRHLREGLAEVRSSIKDGKVEARTYFSVVEGRMILLHGHAGKSTQQHEIAVALRRWKDYRARSASGKS